MGFRMAAAGTPGIGRINFGEPQRPIAPLRASLRRILGYFRPYWRS